MIFRISILVFCSAAFSEQAILRPRVDKPTIYVRNYELTQENINYEECKDNASGTVARSEYVVMNSENACLNTSANDQMEFLKSVLAAVGSSSKVNGFRVFINPYNGLTMEQIATLRSMTAKKVEPIKSDRFKIQIDWDLLKSDRNQVSPVVGEPLHNAVGKSFKEYIENRDRLGHRIPEAALTKGP